MRLQDTWASTSCVLLGTLSTACTPSSGPTSGAVPQAPVRIEANLNGTIASDSDIPVNITVTPDAPCTSFASQVRGKAGAMVTGGARRSHSRCVAGEPVVHVVRARVASGVRASLVVQVTMTVSGQRMETSKTIPVTGGQKARRFDPPP